MSFHNEVSRRRVLALAGTAAAAAAVAGCSSAHSKPPTVNNARKLKLPDELQPKPVPGELVSSVADVPTAYTKYPAPFKTVTEKPGTGDTVTTFQLTYSPPPPKNNKWQAEFEKRLNITFKPTLAQASELAEKTSALIAAGDMPDLFYLNTQAGQAPAAGQSVLQGAFADITDYLAGDAIKDYPNLALFPSYAWNNAALGGRLYGVPRPEPLLQSGTPQIRLDWLKNMGMSLPKNSDDFFDMCVGFAMNDPDGNGKSDTWAFNNLQIYWQNTPILNMFGVPNNWRLNKDGTLTKDIETDEFETSLQYTQKLWKAGAFHPNSAASTFEQQSTLWNSGKIGMYGSAFASGFTKPGVGGLKNWVTDVGVLQPPGHDGGTAALWQGAGTFGMFCIPSKPTRSPDRIRELLRILNYVSAPFGSEESTFMTYGIEGWNYTITNGAPTPSADASKGAELAAAYFCEPNDMPIYLPGPPNRSAMVQKLENGLLPDTIADPTVNLFSATQASKSATLAQQLNDNFVAIVVGRKPFSALKDLRSQWSEQGGDQIRKELQEAIQQTGGSGKASH